MQEKIEVVDTHTGEIHTYTWSNASELRSVHEQLKALEDAIKRARAKLQLAEDKLLGDEDKFDFGDGYGFIRISSATKKFKPEVVKQYLDEDQFSLVIDVNGKRLKDLLAELVKEGSAPAGAWNDIDTNADVTPRKSYIKLEKIGVVK